MSNYEERLAEVEEAFEKHELAAKQLKDKMETIIRDRPSDFIIRRGDRYWTRYWGGSYSFSKLPPDHPYVWREKRRLTAQRQADRLSRITHCNDIEVEEVPRANV